MDCRGKMETYECAHSETKAQPQGQDHETADAGKAGVSAVKDNSNQTGAALYLYRKERRAAFNRLESRASADIQGASGKGETRYE